MTSKWNTQKKTLKRLETDEDDDYEKFCKLFDFTDDENDDMRLSAVVEKSQQFRLPFTQEKVKQSCLDEGCTARRFRRFRHSFGMRAKEDVVEEE